MLPRIARYFLSLTVIIAFANTAKAQTGLCPSNLDFELGDFTGWICRAGQIGTVPLPITGPIPNRHTIINATNASTDPYGGFPTLCPNGSGTSVMLGNHQTGSQTESISYTYTIPATVTVFSMLFFYAVVLESPGHPPPNQPRFQARITDLSTGLPLPCVDFDFIAGSTPGGFQVSPFPGNLGSIVLYKDWTPVSVNLNAYIGRTIMLEFITKDCSQSGHAGYAYLDVSTACNGAISGTNICQGDNSITLTAPFGFQSYAWYSDATFSTIVSTSQTYPLNPAPPVGTVFPVIVTPYAGFGCIDTLYATIGVTPKPVSNAGPDAAICKFQQAQLGGPGAPAHTYSWTPASQVSNPNSPNPLAWNIPPTPTEFIVQTTDILTGCFSYDTTYVSNISVDTAIKLNGIAEFCNYGIPEATLTVNNTSTSIQWYDAATPIVGATAASYQPLVSGNYWAELVQNGCTDTTDVIPIIVDPVPTVSFTFPTDTGCITNNSFVFTNSSAISDNSFLAHNWKFSDGSTMQTTNAVKSFAAVGNYTIQLVVTSAAGCKDSSTISTVHVLPNGSPDFLWDSVCLNRPVLFTNLSNENGSALVSYSWNFNDGGPGSALKNPPLVTYTATGRKDVILQITTLGCEAVPQSITKQVQVNKNGAAIRYRTITVPEGSSAFIHVRDSLGTIYNWQPHVQLSSYNTRYTEFFASGNDVEYLIDITDKSTCLTRDTLLMQILKKPGYYLPTAFTPNGDGLNDVARPYLVGMKSLKSFSIYNRWGNVLFHSVTEGEGWDGTFKGEKQASGVYVWILEFVTTDDKIVTEKGTITVIR
jgi:gliding motility-associated-like protein